MPKLKAVLVIMLSSLCLAATETEERIERIEAGLCTPVVVKGQPLPSFRLAERMKLHRTPGIGIAVINDFEIAWTRGYGIKESNTDDAVTNDTLFQAASISKPVSVMAALHHVEQGVLDMDGDVNAKLKSWKVPGNEFTVKEKVTLRRLASHSAGLTVHGFAGYPPSTDLPTLVQILDGTPPANSPQVRVDVVPGSLFRYSGGGTTVLQLLLEDTLGKPFPEIMKAVVLEPLGMKHSTYAPLPPEKLALAAKGHSQAGTLVPGKFHIYPERAAASLWTTPSDLCRVALEVMLSCEGKSNKVIAQETAREMLTVQKSPAGLGFFISGEGKEIEFSHTGGNRGYRCELVAFPRLGMGAAVMTNADGGGYLIKEVLAAIALEYGWPSRRPSEREAIEIAADRLDAMAGRYKTEQGIEIKIWREDNRLMGSGAGYPPERLYAATESSFFVLSRDMEVTFKENGKGGFDGLDLNVSRMAFKAERVE